MILEQVNHPCIIHLYEILHDSENFYIITELVNGSDMFTYINEMKKQGKYKFSEQEVQLIAKQLFSTLLFLNQK